MKNENLILYVQTTNQPEKQYSPLVLAQTARAMDLEARLYYLGLGLTILMPGVADGIKVGSFPSVGEMLKKAMDMGVQVYACEASKQLMGLDKVQLLPGVKIIGAATLNDMALEAGTTMWF
ncbi:MAG: DsrE/DsrF/DrsH-like family protein [bacterium]|nr:DsrE/DsrF/DrsH-like family protein [bacterium]